MYRLYCILSAFALFGVLFPQFALILIFVFGLGFVFIIAPSLWMYVTCALPGLYLWQRKNKPLLGSVLSIVGVLSLAIVPPYIASVKSQNLITEATVDDFDQLDSIDFLSEQIIIFEKVERLRAPFMYGGEYNVPCRRLCQRLLLEGLGGKRGVFVAVSGKVHRYNSNQFQNKGSFYRIEKRPHCSQRHAGRVYEMFIETFELASKRGECIVRYSSNVVPDGIAFDERILKDDAFIPRTSIAYTTKAKRLEISELTKEQKKPLLRSTSIRVRKATYPTLIVPSGSFLHAVTALPFFSTFDQKQSLNIVDVFEKKTGHNLKKNLKKRSSQYAKFDRLYFELGKSKHQLPAEFETYFKIPADETFVVP